MSNDKEELEVSFHPLAPGIPLSRWRQLTKDQQDKMAQTIFSKYERINNTQLQRQEQAEEISDNAGHFKKALCFILGHKPDWSMLEEYYGEPDTFMRVDYCLRCGRILHSMAPHRGTLWFLLDTLNVLKEV